MMFNSRSNPVLMESTNELKCFLSLSLPTNIELKMDNFDKLLTQLHELPSDRAKLNLLYSVNFQENLLEHYFPIHEKSLWVDHLIALFNEFTESASIMTILLIHIRNLFSTRSHFIQNFNTLTTILRAFYRQDHQYVETELLTVFLSFCGSSLLDQLCGDKDAAHFLQILSFAQSDNIPDMIIFFSPPYLSKLLSQKSRIDQIINFPFSADELGNSIILTRVLIQLDQKLQEKKVFFRQSLTASSALQLHKEVQPFFNQYFADNRENSENIIISSDDKGTSNILTGKRPREEDYSNYFNKKTTSHGNNDNIFFETSSPRLESRKAEELSLQKYQQIMPYLLEAIASDPGCIVKNETVESNPDEEMLYELSGYIAVPFSLLIQFVSSQQEQSKDKDTPEISLTKLEELQLAIKPYAAIINYAIEKIISLPEYQQKNCQVSEISNNYGCTAMTFDLSEETEQFFVNLFKQLITTLSQQSLADIEAIGEGDQRLLDALFSSVSAENQEHEKPASPVLKSF